MQLVEQLKKMNSVQIIDHIDSYQEAIHLCFKPLLDQQYITQEYAKNVIEKGKELNFYYLLTQGMAMPHARPEDGALKNGISFLLVKDGVQFESHEFNPVYCLVGLVATDSDSHILNMMDIATIFGDNLLIVDELRKANSIEDILSTLNV